MGFKLVLNDVDGVAAVVVATLVAGGQAAAAGVESGSRLLAVGGASVRTGAPDAYGVLGLKRDASAAEARRAACAAPLARAALDGDAEAGLLVGIALLRVDAAAERAKALAPARARTRSSRRRALVRGGGRFADAPEHSQK